MKVIKNLCFIFNTFVQKLPVELPEHQN